MGCDLPRGHACTHPSCDQDVLLFVVLDVLDLEVEVVVVTACAGGLLDVLLHDVCSRCTTSCCPFSSACCTAVSSACESVVLEVVVPWCTRRCSSFVVLVLLCTRRLRLT